MLLHAKHQWDGNPSAEENPPMNEREKDVARARVSSRLKRVHPRTEILFNQETMTRARTLTLCQRTRGEATVQSFAEEVVEWVEWVVVWFLVRKRWML